MDTLTAVEQAIVRIIRQRQRNYPPHRGVLPVTIACFLDEYRAQQTVRRDCVALWQRGELVRMGGEGSRRGYRVPPLPVAVDARAGRKWRLSKCSRRAAGRSGRSSW